MATYDIPLPARTRPVFPPRCVCCGKEDPGGLATLSVTGADSGPGVGEVALDAVLGAASRSGSNKRVTVQVPACPACAKALQWRHFWKTVLLYAGALGGVVLFVISLALWHSGWIGGLLLAAGILGPVIWELRHPPAFTFTPAGGRTIYEFRSESYSRDFATLNPLPVPI